MDKDTVYYIITHLQHLMTENERRANHNFQLKLKLAEMEDPSEIRRKWFTDKMVFNEEIDRLMTDDWPTFEIKVAERILKEHRAEVFASACKKCGQLLRTPDAKQCRHCGYDWH